MKREVWDKCGPFAVDRRKTFMFVDKVHTLGGKVAFLNNKLLIVHCGIKSLINQNGMSEKMERESILMADAVGAKIA